MVIGTKTTYILPDITVVAISGRLNLGGNLSSVEGLINRLIQEGIRKLILDLADLAAVDSAAIGMLVATSGIMEQAGGRIRMASPQGLVAKVFDIVHLDRILPIDASVQAAVAAFASGGDGRVIT